MADNEYSLDKKQVRRNFDCAANTYDKYAVLQQEIAGRLDERFEFIKINPQRIVDLGVGTGQVSFALAKRFRKSQIIGMDISLEMAKAFFRRVPWHKRFSGKISSICADIEVLPLLNDSCELLVSSLTLQWCNDLEQVFAEAKRILKPGGLFMFTSFGPDSLKELRSCWGKLDSDTHVSAFYDMHDLGDAMLRHGFLDPVMDIERITSYYDSVKELMVELKMIGASNVTSGRPRGLLNKSKWKALQENYELYRSDKGLPASYEIVYGHAWVPSIESRGVCE